MQTLRSKLVYEPKELKFGTSGRRGEVRHLTQLEVYINALGELHYLQELPAADGGIRRGEEFYFAHDLRPSSTCFVPEQEGRGELCQAIEQAVRDAGLQPINLGAIPTPAISYYAFGRTRGSIMVTGSHIPFDRNGYKLNTSRGELLKAHEEPIGNWVRKVRERIYNEPFERSLFDERGMFKDGHRGLPPIREEGATEYVRRYLDFFAGEPLKGRRVVIYEHSAVGRDLLGEILRGLGAEVFPVGRSEQFVPIDTENIGAEQLAVIQRYVDEVRARRGEVLAAVSTDGDSDRPLITGFEADGATVKFFGGDLVGMVVAEYLGADAVVVPVSCNDAIDRGPLATVLEPKTRIGSPYVIAGMEAAKAKGRQRVCGWEANGGFLTGSDIVCGERVLKALPTRDAVLPILCVLCAAAAKNVPVAELFARLPQRFSRAGLLRPFSQELGRLLVRRLSPGEELVTEVRFTETVEGSSAAGEPVVLAPGMRAALEHTRRLLESVFTPQLGFGAVQRLNYTDGVRVYFSNGDVAHIRPSGNADELRIYAVADTQSRADAIVAAALEEPDGIFRKLQQMLL